MNPLDLEAFALRELDRVVKGQRVEDSTVELKREWPTDHFKAARRIAGHCNAAPDSAVVWIFGRGEDGSASDQPTPETHEWIAQVGKYFDGVAPRLLTDARFLHKDSPATALLLDTRQRPYVVRVPCHKPNAGTARLEVPWREGTAIRSARREDLVRMLLPAARIPRFELIEGQLSFGLWSTSPENNVYCNGELRLYILADDRVQTILPIHRMKAWIRAHGCTWEAPLCPSLSGWPTPMSDLLVQTGPGGIVAHGPGQFVLSLSTSSQVRPPERATELELELTCSLAPVPSVICLRILFSPRDATGGNWQAIGLLD